MNNIITAPYRYDSVGSFLRPIELKQARADFKAGKITREQLTIVEDKAVTEIVQKQKSAGYHIITDGEFRREFWHLDFMWGFEGVAHEDTGSGVQFNDELARLDEVYLVGKIKAPKVHSFVEGYKFLKQFEDENTVAKVTIPAPAQTYQQFVVPQNINSTRKFYKTDDELIVDIATAYRKVILDLYEEGCRNIQFDDCTWGVLVSKGNVARYSDDTNLDDIKEKLLRVNNLAIEGKPDDLIINTHVCRGNYHSTFFSSGPYDNVAKELFGKENVDAYYLEYDDERSGGFEPLKYISGEKKVVLGLITTKSPKLEDKETIKKRIAEASKYIPLDRLYISPQCGFASCEIGNKLTEDEQWAKLALVKEIAEEVWGDNSIY